ncbi:thioesterase II family protein [Streptomyces sp. NPDC059853]|uniref:thioesterase II family protein n=1 Tax=Streptomyces sp. NPDC059853 TaxID=3346973 RepID=UPI003662F5F4
MSTSRRTARQPRWPVRSLYSPAADPVADEHPAPTPSTVAASRAPVSGISASWLHRVREGHASDGPRFVFFPPAGSSASAARPLLDAVPREWEVWSAQYPSRGPRRRDPPAESIRDMALTCLPELLEAAPGTVFGGHSFGALLAYDVVQLLEQRGQAPAGLLVSSVPAPGTTLSDVAVEELSDDALVASLREQGATLPEVLANDELMGLVLPALRSDLSLARSYRDDHGRRLSTPVLGLGGRDDLLTSLEQLLTWRHVTERWLGHILGEGGHFYYLHDPAPLTGALSRLRPSWPEWNPAPGRSGTP